MDRVHNAGGEITAVVVAAGSVWLRGRVNCRSEISRLQESLAQIPGVIRLNLRMTDDTDDTEQKCPEARQRRPKCPAPSPDIARNLPDEQVAEFVERICAG